MGRFLPTARHRLVVSKWDPTAPQTETVMTFLDRHALNRQFQAVFGGPASLSGEVWSNDPEVNILFTDNFGIDPLGFWPDDYPFLNEGVRLLRWFRKYQDQEDWTCRFGGHILETVDTGDENTGRTRFVAYDPWQYLMRRPVYRVKCSTQDCSSWTDYTVPANALPGPGGVTFHAGTWNLGDLIGELLRRTIVLDGPVGIDAGTSWGGTAFYTGNFDSLAPLSQDLSFQQGTSVGQAWQQIMDTSLAEIVLSPIYDPANRPGYVAELNVYDTSTFFGPTATFAPFYWDRSGHDLTQIVRAIDGRERANQVQFYIGGPAAGKVPVNLQTDTDSVTRYGDYWDLETRLPTIDSVTVTQQAQLELEERRAGHMTWTFSPTPEFTLRPLDDYGIGSYVYQYNSNRLREEVVLQGNCRIRSMTIDMSNEGVETVSQMELWADGT